MSDDDKAKMEALLEEFVRTYVSFRPVLVGVHGTHLHWKVVPVIHDAPVPPADESMYLTGDGVPSPSGTFA